MTLTDKQQSFVDAYLAGEDVNAAVLQAGYSTKRPGECGRRLMKSKKVMAALQQHAPATASEIDQDWIIRQLVLNVERAMGDPALDSDGKAGGRGSYQGAVVNRALELLGKHYGLFAERVDIHYHHEEALEALA